MSVKKPGQNKWDKTQGFISLPVIVKTKDTLWPPDYQKDIAFSVFSRSPNVPIRPKFLKCYTSISDEQTIAERASICTQAPWETKTQKKLVLESIHSVKALTYSFTQWFKPQLGYYRIKSTVVLRTAGLYLRLRREKDGKQPVVGIQFVQKNYRTRVSFSIPKVTASNYSSNKRSIIKDKEGK